MKELFFMSLSPVLAKPTVPTPPPAPNLGLFAQNIGSERAPFFEPLPAYAVLRGASPTTYDVHTFRTMTTSSWVPTVFHNIMAAGHVALSHVVRALPGKFGFKAQMGLISSLATHGARIYALGHPKNAQLWIKAAREFSGALEETAYHKDNKKQMAALAENTALLLRWLGTGDVHHMVSMARRNQSSSGMQNVVNKIGRGALVKSNGFQKIYAKYLAEVKSCHRLGDISFDAIAATTDDNKRLTLYQQTLSLWQQTQGMIDPMITKLTDDLRLVQVSSSANDRGNAITLAEKQRMQGMLKLLQTQKQILADKISTVMEVESRELVKILPLLKAQIQTLATSIKKLEAIHRKRYDEQILLGQYRDQKQYIEGLIKYAEQRVPDDALASPEDDELLA